MTAVSAPALGLPRRAAGTRSAVRAHLLVGGGQAAAGVGNLAFALAAARVLAPRAFAELAVFLALYLVLNMPSMSLTAVLAAAPERAAAAQRRLLPGTLVVAAVLAVMAVPLATAIRVPTAMVLALASATPASPLLALARGRLYGERREAGIVATLLAEPAVRLGLGVSLAAAVGAVGAAVAVVVAGYAALEVARLAARSGRLAVDRAAPAVPAAPGALLGAFLALAVLQNLDLVLANRLLEPGSAGAYAALSTLGGVAAFGSATVPLVMLPRIAARERSAFSTAVVIAGAIGGGAALVGAVAPQSVVTTVYGARYGAIAHVVGPYLLAMALLGVLRVLVAQSCVAGKGRSSVVVLAAGALGQAVAITEAPRRPDAIALTTLAVMAAVTTVEGTRVLWRAADATPGLAERAHRLRRAVSWPALAALAIGGVAGAVRLAIPRGLWLDEATSVFEAKMGFAAMLHQLRNFDVHPPLYFSVLWASVRALGTGELAVRAPSVVFGVAIVPLAYVAARDLWDARTGWVAASLATVAPLMVWYSQEARMYSMFMFFSLAAVWAQAMVVRRGRKLDWIVWVLASVALGWTEYFGLLQVVVQQAVFAAVVVHRRTDEDVKRLVRGWAVGTAVMLALFAPLAPMAIHQFGVNQRSGRGFNTTVAQAGTSVSGLGARFGVYSVLANITWAGIGYHSDSVMARINSLWPAGILAALVALGRRPRTETRIVIAGIVGPAFLLAGLAAAKPTLLDVRYLAGIVPLIVVLMARVLTGVTRRATSVIAATVLVVGGLGAGLVDQQYNGANPRVYDFRAALGHVAQLYRPGDQLFYAPADLEQVVQYFVPGVPSATLAGNPTRTTMTGRVFVIVSDRLIDRPSDAKAFGDDLVALAQDRRVVERFRVPNVVVWVYS